MTRSLCTPTKNYCIRVSQTFCKSFTELHSQIEMIPHPEKLTDHWIQGDFLCATPRGCISDSLLRQQWSSGHPTLAGGTSRPRPRITTTTSVAMMKVTVGGKCHAFTFSSMAVRRLRTAIRGKDGRGSRLALITLSAVRLGLLFITGSIKVTFWNLLLGIIWVLSPPSAQGRQGIP
ncbi:hypothetical protein V8E53_011977 [Lactarius tabidus]